MVNEFLNLVSEVFEKRIFEMPAGQIIGGAIIMIAFLAVRRIFANTVIFYLTKLTKRTKTKLDEIFLEALKGPLKFIPIVLGIFFFTQWFELSENALKFFLTIVKTLIAFVLFWAAYNVLTPLSSVLETILSKLTQKSETLFAEEFTQLIIRALKIAVMIVGFIIILSQWGINVVPLLGGLGILGMAVGFGAQDSIANIFGGIKILLDGQFRRGDWIQTPDIEGTVFEIGIATTKVREFDKAITSIPNKRMSESAIKNYSRMTNRRVKMTIGVEYSSTANQLENIVDRIREYLQSNPDIAQPETESVLQMAHLTSFGASSIDISLYYFTKTTNWVEWRRVVHENIIEYKRIVEREGAAFAFPSQSIYLESTPWELNSIQDVERLKGKTLAQQIGKRRSAGEEEGGEG
jgi:MscS family membrane protein